MENREFLIDPHTTTSSNKNPMEEDFEDHSQFMSSPTSTTVSSAGGGANNNLLLDGQVETVGSGDGTFLVADHDDSDDHHNDGTRNQQPHSYGHHEESPSSLMYDNVGEEEDDDDVAKHALAAAAAAAQVTGRSSQHSSSIDDFEFIATPQSTTDREVKMDNLLDFEPQPAPVGTKSLPVNLVETLLTGEDLKPHTTSAGAYLENEFAQFNSGSQPSQDFTFQSATGKPVKDVYTDFMEAERGGGGARVALMQSATPKPPIETVSSTPTIPEPAANNKRDEEKQVNYHDGVDDDLLEQFAAAPSPPPRAMEMKPEVKKLEDEVKPMVIEKEPKQETPKTVPIVSEVKQQPPQPEPKEVIKPKDVDAPKPPTPTPTPVVAATAAAVAQKKQPQKKDELITTSAEEMFCKFGLDAWFKPERLHPRVESLIYWRDVKKSGIVCGAGMVILLAMSCFSVISVFAYVSLLALAGTVAFRIYKSVMQAIQKTSEGHPFKAFMDFELQLPQEKVQQVTGVAVSHINSVLAELRRLFLVEDLVDSIKFGLMLWCLTYVGAWFNGMTLVILSYVALFTLPKVYETNKQSIDAYLDLVRSKINEITEKVKAAIPIGKKVESDKEK